VAAWIICLLYLIPINKISFLPAQPRYPTFEFRPHYDKVTHINVLGARILLEIAMQIMLPVPLLEKKPLCSVRSQSLQCAKMHDTGKSHSVRTLIST
jgi:hypothetical protein